MVGAPGAGKTGSAVLLVLDALEHREGVEASQRVRVLVLVLVLVTAYGWDPVTCPVRDWLVDRLVASYPQLFAHRGGRAEAAALVAAGAVALVLDGLDEMDVARRPVALRALSDAPFRVLVLTRSQEMVQATGVAYLVGAVALQLRDVTGPEGADYLHRARTGPPPSGWTQLLTHLRDNPDSALTRGLSTPLALTLIRDTYRPSEDVGGLLTIRWSTADHLEQHLIARVLPAAYTRRPGSPEPPYSQTQARQVLAFLARQMNQDHTRDLAWWQIPRWAPTTPRILASTLAGGFMGAILGGLAVAVPVTLVAVVLAFAHESRHGLGPGLGGVVMVEYSLLLGLALGLGLPLGLVSGRGGHEPKRVRSWRAINWRSVLTAGLAYALVGVLAYLLAFGLAGTLVADFIATRDQRVQLMAGLAAQLVGGLAAGITLGLSGWHGEDQGNPPELVKSRRKNRLFGLVFGLAAGIVTVHSYHLGFVAGLVVGLVAWLVVGLILGLMPRLAGGFVAGLAVGFADGEPSPQGPRESWRHDQAFGLRVGLGLGLGMGFWLGLLIGLKFGPVLELVNFLTGEFSVALVYGITSSVTWSTTLAWRQLRRARRVPAVALMPFLEDARGRGVLRTVGAVYQFRHATLQDQLAEHTTGSPQTSSTDDPDRGVNLRVIRRPQGVSTAHWR